MMKEKKKWPLAEAMPIANRLYKEFAPHCKRICVVGSLRRMKNEVSDIDIICIAKDFSWGLLKDGLAEAVDKYKKILGDMNGDTKYVRRETPEGIGFDLWLIDESNWGLVINTRTGPPGYSHGTLACGWSRAGYQSINNYLHNKKTGEKIDVPEEIDLYRLIGEPYKKPEDRG